MACSESFVDMLAQFPNCSISTERLERLQIFSLDKTHENGEVKWKKVLQKSMPLSIKWSDSDIASL